MTENSAKPANKPPVAKLRVGLVNASIWERTTDNGSFHSVTFERRYKDAKGNWKSTTSFDSDDLLILAKLANEAHSEILRLKSSAA